MSKDEQGYNGWSNYETWCVNLWLTNEQSGQLYWQEQARTARALAPESEQVKDGIWTEEQAARFSLADKLKNEIEEGNPLVDSASMWSDLLQSALDNVDWSEIAGNMISGLDE